MSEKRRDNKGRVLHNGENQRPNGQYEFKYFDAKGIRRSVYSWRLVETDSLPKGKRKCDPLREIEKRVIGDTEAGIDAYTARKTTLNAFFDSYIEMKFELKQSTRTNYKYMYKRHIENGLGQKKLSDIKYKDIKKFYMYLINEKDFKPNSVEIMQTLLHPIFNMAIREGYIRINPTDGVIGEIKKSHDWEKPKRHPLTVDQQTRLVEFTSRHKVYNHWMTIITVLLGTGCRIGEILGLRWEDCDFDENIIHINHNLIYRQQDDGKCEKHITTPKTKTGIRIVPMFREVKDTLLEEYHRQERDGFNTFIVDGYTNFIFQSRYHQPLTPAAVNRALHRITRDANAEEIINAKKEDREPVLLPIFSCHHLRHTFCTRMCENENNLKVIQEIMGHADITTTMDIYNEATKEKKISTFANLEGKMKIA